MHSEGLADPRNQAEGLDRAACGPHPKHLAELAAAAAADGASATNWRTDVLTHVGPTATGPLDTAETCMRQAGLWPWKPLIMIPAHDDAALPPTPRESVAPSGMQPPTALPS